MTEINAAYLEFRYSGGANNTNPQSSLGGAISNTKVARFNAKYYSLGSNTSVNNSTAVTTSGPFQIIDANGFELTDSNRTPYLGDTVNKIYIGLKIRDGVMGLFSTRVTQQPNTSSSNIDFISPLMPWTMHPAPVILEDTGKYILRHVSTKMKNANSPDYTVGSTFKDFEILQLRYGIGISDADLVVSPTGGTKVVQPPYASQDCDIYEIVSKDSFALYTDENLVNISSYTGTATCSLIKNGEKIPHGFSDGNIVFIRFIDQRYANDTRFGAKKIKVIDSLTFSYEYLEKQIALTDTSHSLSRSPGRLFYGLFDSDAEISGWVRNSEVGHGLAGHDTIAVQPVKDDFSAMGLMPGSEYFRFFSNFEVTYLSEKRVRITTRESDSNYFNPYVISITLQGFLAICHVITGASLDYFNEQNALVNQPYFNGVLSGGSIAPHGFNTGDIIEIKVPVVKSTNSNGELVIVSSPDNIFVKTPLICASRPEDFVGRSSRQVAITVIDATTFSFPLLIQN